MQRWPWQSPSPSMRHTIGAPNYITICTTENKSNTEFTWLRLAATVMSMRTIHVEIVRKLYFVCVCVWGGGARRLFASGDDTFPDASYFRHFKIELHKNKRFLGTAPFWAPPCYTAARSHVINLMSKHAKSRTSGVTSGVKSIWNRILFENIFFFLECIVSHKTSWCCNHITNTHSTHVHR